MTLTVTGIEWTDESPSVDITVPQNHNYFSSEHGRRPVLVHNCTEKVVYRTIGPVVAKGNAASDLPHIELLETGISSGRQYRNWNSMIKYLTTLEERNRIIIRNVFKDLRENKMTSVLITTVRREHVTMLVKMINAQAAYCNEERGERWPVELAVAYMGGTDTNAALKLANSGRVRVVVSMVSMSQFGLDVCRWTHVYIGVVPTSNPYNTYQLINRVCTSYPPALRAKLPPKPLPVARILIDAIDASVFCFAKIFKDPLYGLQAGLGTQNFFGVKLFKMRWDVLKRAADIAEFPKSYDPNDVGISMTLGKTRTGKQRRKAAWKPKKGGITRL